MSKLEAGSIRQHDGIVKPVSTQESFLPKASIPAKVSLKRARWLVVPTYMCYTTHPGNGFERMKPERR